jgi:hypothetical protein
MTLLTLPLSARSLRMPALCIRTGGVVEEKLAPGPPTAPQTGRVERAQLEDDLARQPADRGRIRPLQVLADGAVLACLEANASMAAVCELREPCRLRFNASLVEQSID